MRRMTSPRLRVPPNTSIDLLCNLATEKTRASCEPGSWSEAQQLDRIAALRTQLKAVLTDYRNLTKDRP